eukprot:CAMPEP_0119495630 /NCGR_PEP_ID=MMETSP1344-20130328/19188_1 /TAXON_ID=236787 /ORGANISM="Florenciella parvula, Strain CCMP2471" /LENGTH=397 /DNA_ID=CAMNT_0007531223 /DNA_START=32 /DNA_END=1225 /DNA_ORIENTATION=+
MARLVGPLAVLASTASAFVPHIPRAAVGGRLGSNLAATGFPQAPLPAWAGLSIENFLLQRSIQTQIYYLHDLRDEPQSAWIASFLDHEHLDDKDLCGEFVVKGKKSPLDGLNVGWEDYMTQLSDTPNETIEIELANPNQGYVSQQELKNPYLQQQQLLTIKYDEVIEPAKIAQRLLVTCNSLLREFQFDLRALAAADSLRAERDLRTPEIPDDKARAPQYKENNHDLTPLAELNKRALHRYVTVLAFKGLLEELAEYEEMAEAYKWFAEVADEWMPLLKLGADDEARERIGKAPPGMYYRRHVGGGADAFEAIEVVWQTLPFHDDLDNVHGRVDPLELATRLRELRAAAALEVVEELGRMQPGIDEFQGTVAIKAEQSTGAIAPNFRAGRPEGSYIQ